MLQKHERHHDYFVTSSKKSDLKNFVGNNVGTLTQKKIVNAMDTTILITEEVPSVNCTVSKTENAHSKKKKKSHPVVKNITEIFSNSVVSPNNSSSTISKIVECNDVIHRKEFMDESTDLNKKCSVRVPTSKENISEESCENTTGIFSCKEEHAKELSIIKSEVCSSNLNYTTVANEDSQTLKSAPNAFDLMMESRNKSIGQNSPGKELFEDERNYENKDDRKKLSARKNLLENWADRKGGLKRKQIEEDKDKIIQYKLAKRAKRFKKLLKVNETVRVTPDSPDIIVKKRVIRPLESNSESSKDSVEVIECVRTDTSKRPVLDISEENAQDKVIKNFVKSRDNRQGLLSFFGVLNKSNSAKEIEQENNKSQKEKEIVPNMSENLIQTEGKQKNHKRKRNYKKASQRLCAGKSEEKLQSSNDQRIENKIRGKINSKLTSRCLKSWKMKIKLGTDNNEPTNRNDEDISKNDKQNTSFTDLTSVPDESSNDGKFKLKSHKKNKTKTRKSQSGEIVSYGSDDFLEKRRSTRISSKPVKMLSNKIILLEDEDDSQEKAVEKRIAKVAPIFLKTTPKPKLAPDIIEARRQFLMSGIPLSLKKTLERQQSMEEREYDIFPSISHVQQKCDSPFWTLTKPELSLKTYLPSRIDPPASCSDITTSSIPSYLHIKAESKKVDKLKTLLNRIKADNPNYPVYKSFRLIYEKSGNLMQPQKHQKQPKQKTKKKNTDDSLEIIEIDTEECDLIEYTMWTEKYKPKSTDDIIGNAASIKSIKKWLEAWLTYSQDIIVKKKKRRHDSTSESEFDTTDCDSRDSTRLPGNTIILGGPCGSGKSTAVYAVCQELGYSVIELNASSKRTGKRLLQELQEATQSHQVRKNDQNLQNFLQTKAHKEKKPSIDPQKEKKMCVLLIEDIDIVFEQDDGFISGLTQLVTTSKRPIVMTTTDPSSVFAQRFISQYEYISFLRLSSQMLATWLQIVCLVEGLFVSRDDIGCLLEFNMGDMRKTLLELQFWVQTGGQLNRDDILTKVEDKRKSTEEKLSEDEPPLLFLKDDNKKREEDCTFVHSNCIGSFEIFRGHKSYSVPYHFNLGLLWWNIPNFINITNFSLSRLNKFENSKTSEDAKKRKTTIDDKIKLLSVEKLYESLALTDVIFRKVSYMVGSEPNVKNYSSEIRDSLELNECMDDCNGYSDFVHEVTHTLINGYIEEYNSIEGKKSSVNMALPDRIERRWRAKHHVCEDVFQEALSFSSYVERKSVALDYMPTLRNISRSEFHRAANNTKRRNRFRNYLRDLNVKCTDGTIKLACSILRMNDE